MEQAHNHLRPIIIQRKRFAHSEQTVYRVYSAPGEYQLVEANTANEAFEKSGIRRPHKIERETLHHQASVRAGLLSDAPEEETTAFDPNLPDPQDLGPVLYAILSEQIGHEPEQTFESISILDLRKKAPAPAEPLPAEAAPLIAEPDAMHTPLQPDPEPVAATAAEEPESEALTPEQVEALLRGE